jgi:peptidoglycan/xylan/chitin deacetylase (PgdA/CDA1 family)
MPALILMYHDLAADPTVIAPGHRPYVLEPAVFHRQMAAVIATALPVLTVAQWCAPTRPARAVVLTFDDGHVSNYTLTLPILMEHHLSATFFITAGAIGKGATMDWRQIRALHAAGMEIGSHTLTHRPPSTLNDDELRYELRESRRVLEDGLGAPVTSISSPTGFFNPRMRAIAREAGYQSLSFGQIGLAADQGDAFSLQRVAVKYATPHTEFEALLRFDRRLLGRWRRQQWLRSIARQSLGPSAYLQVRRLLSARRARV